MNTIKLTYKVIAHNNPFAQKTISAIVSKNNVMYDQFEETIDKRFSEENCKVEYNHAGKVVILNYKG